MLDISSIEAWLRPVLPGGKISETGQIACTVTRYNAGPTYPDGWFLTANSAALPVGQYAMIALISIGRETFITTPAPIRLIL